MGDDDQGDGMFRGKIEKDFHNFAAIFGIEIASGLVGEEHFGFVHDGSGDGDALLLATGKFGGEVLGAVGQADALECVHGGSGGIAAGDRTRDGDVFQGGEFGQQVVILEHVADEGVAESSLLAAAEGIKVGPGDGHAAALRVFKPGKSVEQGGFTGTAGATQKQPFAAPDAQVNATEHLNGFMTHPVAAVQIHRFNHHVAHPPSLSQAAPPRKRRGERNSGSLLLSKKLLRRLKRVVVGWVLSRRTAWGLPRWRKDGGIDTRM